MRKDWSTIVQQLPATGMLAASSIPQLNVVQNAINSVEQSSGSGVFPSEALLSAVVGCLRTSGGPNVPTATSNGEGSVLHGCTTDQVTAALVLASVIGYELQSEHSTKALLQKRQQSAGTSMDVDIKLPADDGATDAAALAAAAAAAADTAAHQFHAQLLKLGDDAAIANWLCSILQEGESQRQLLLKIVKELGWKSVASILARIVKAYDEQDGAITQRMDGGGKRSLGGAFIKEWKKEMAARRKVGVAAELPALEPLRSYQRTCLDSILRSWGLGPAPAPPPGPGSTRRNWLVTAPTGSGKTRIFIEVTRGVVANCIAQGRGARVVILVPNVILTDQHATYYERAELPGGAIVRPVSSDRPLGAIEWRGMLQVPIPFIVVATAASFQNLLRPGPGADCEPAARLDQLDLLVLDEAHHCHDQHPYRQVMELYSPSANPRTFVLGFTASPASEVDMPTLHLAMSALLGCLHADLYLIDEEDPEVCGVISRPIELDVRVPARGVDLAFVSFVKGVALSIADDVATALLDCTGSRAEDVVAVTELATALNEAVAACRGGSGGGVRRWIELDPLGQWIAKGREFAAMYDVPRLDAACRFLDMLRKGVALVEDCGVDGALPFLARKAAAMACEGQQPPPQPLLPLPQAHPASTPSGSSPAGTPGPAPGPGPAQPPATARLPPSVFRGGMLSAMRQGGGGGAQATTSSSTSTAAPPAASPEARTPGAGAAAATAAVSVGSGAPAGGDSAVARLAFHAAAAPPPCALAPSQTRTIRPCDGDQELLRSRCADVPEALSVAVLAGRLLGPLLERPSFQQVAVNCFASGRLQQETTFPKFWALLSYLVEKYGTSPAWHGIVFVRTRQVVFQLADTIRRAEQLTFVEVLELIGHSDTGSGDGTAQHDDRHNRGMTDAQQQQVLHMFKAPGRKLLIATSTAEEGLDVQRCEFVVRYNAAATGIQLVQSRGRARKRAVAEFVSLIQEETVDEHLHAKSRKEEETMLAYQRKRREQRQQDQGV